MAKNNKPVVDMGSAYGFVGRPAFTHLPGGVYYPGVNPDGIFYLSKGNVPDEREEGEAPAPPGNAMQVTSTNGPITGGAPAPVPSEVSYAFVSENYFPMERYNPGLEKIDGDIRAFLGGRELYGRRGLDYKRSILFYGPPGTGKSRYIQNLEQELVAGRDAVVIRVETVEHLRAISYGAVHLNHRVRDRFKVVVIEELADFCDDHHSKTQLLQLLDSAVMRRNLLFLVSTNNPEAIPTNLIDRPSRLDLLAGVYPKDNREGFVEAWHEHLLGEAFPEEEQGTDWLVEAKRELSPAYWRELFIFSHLQNKSLREAWGEIKERRTLIKNNFREGEMGFNTFGRNGKHKGEEAQRDRFDSIGPSPVIATPNGAGFPRER